MRYVIYGAGAIGGTIGGRLHEAGRDVVLIARGAHLDALRRDGLRLRSPDEDRLLDVPAVGSPAEADLGPDDVVLLCMKTQDTEAALDELVPVAPPSLPVVCVQNGVENERLVLRRFARVYAMLVFLPAEHLAPGVVGHNAAPRPGILDLGPYPPRSGAAESDPLVVAIAEDLEAAGFGARPLDAVMAWKYQKILRNLANAADAAMGLAARNGTIHQRAREEALACYAAAGIVVPTREEELHRRESMSSPRPLAGTEHRGSSSWQSLARGAGRIEADWLNGEIVLLGRLHDVPTPVNAALQRLANRMARERQEPGSMTPEAFEREVEGYVDEGVPEAAE